ncbi:Protein glycosylation K [Lactobacillus helveticus]|nr:Protein glycosylation K [Lactobacillus helveticus]NRN94487.1 Protein glycosylation K [Lactobacillus helveticus]NRO27394.1 Protein glycosylation K [Lactobacillus helveticus]NRO55377.1 Protein glycosylation K [Lactobacillus helveticus]NRO59220.1 Protein glycosylation K [Lactobacillus helveticus]
MVVNGQTTLGTLFAIVQLSNSFVNPILAILEDCNKLSTTKKIDIKAEKYIAEGEKAEDISKNDFIQLEVDDLTLIRKDQELAKHLNLKIKAGQKVAVIGPSGAGKSTLLQYLMTGKFGQAKDIILNNKQVKTGEFASIFSYASQSPVIFADTLRFNLTLGADISQEMVLKICTKLGLDNMVKEKGWDYSLGDNADQLSGGQLARIELARAILVKQPVLLLDEINASLDKKTSDQIHDYLLESDLTFVEVIHHYEPEELQRYDQVIDLEQFV